MTYDLNAAFRVKDAIDDSIREGDTAVLDATLDTYEWVALSQTLYAMSAGKYTEHQDDATLTRVYTGTDDDGDTWRVELRGRKG